MPGAYTRRWTERRLAVERNPTLRGLDYIETAGGAGKTGPLELRLWFIPSVVPEKTAAPSGVVKQNIRIDGPYGPIPSSAVEIVGSEDRSILIRVARTSATRDLWGVIGEIPLALVDLPDIDPFFSEATFRIVNRGDNAMQASLFAPTAGLDEPPIDYLNKDYTSFRQTMLACMALWAPAWLERNAADLGMTLVEILAYAGDQLSYYQDAVGTERYLETARLRVSVRRHLRLIGYRLHDGCNARVWMHVSVAEAVTVPAGTKFFAASVNTPAQRIDSQTYESLLEYISHVYESMYDADLYPEQNLLSVYTWGAESYVLEAGATSATFYGHVPGLRKGSLLSFEYPLGPEGNHAAWVVRLSSDAEHGTDELYDRAITIVEWYEEDALPDAIRFAAGGVPENPSKLVRGNILPADEGLTIVDEQLEQVEARAPYRPTLANTGITVAQPLFGGASSTVAASSSLQQNPLEAIACVSVRTEIPEEPGEFANWFARNDLLLSSPSSRNFVVEIEASGTATLRFGNDILGMRPRPTALAWATYRLGNGTSGNVAALMINRVVSDDPRVMSAYNPMPAQGGINPEDVASAIKLAPNDLILQRRCVNDSDYRARALEQPEVENAYVDRAWRGQQEVVRIYVHRTGDLTETPEFLDRVQKAIEAWRVIGTKIEVRPPRYIPLNVHMRVTVEKRASLPLAQRAVYEAFSSVGGFFDPVRFSFGTAVFSSQLVELAMQQPGVQFAEVLNLSIESGHAPAAGYVRGHGSRILRLDTQPIPQNEGSLLIEFEQS